MSLRTVLITCAGGVHNCLLLNACIGDLLAGEHEVADWEEVAEVLLNQIVQTNIMNWS